MTPREHWDAAIALQHRTAAEIDACDAQSRFVDLVAIAREELMSSFLAMPVSPEVYRQLGDAYGIRREAELRAKARFRRCDALAAVETVRGECCDLVARGLAAEQRIFQSNQCVGSDVAVGCPYGARRSPSISSGGVTIIRYHCDVCFAVYQRRYG